MSESDFLFARPSFLEGIARTLDMHATLQDYNRSVSTEQADAWALFKDFEAVGKDIRRAMESLEPAATR